MFQHKAMSDFFFFSSDIKFYSIGEHYADELMDALQNLIFNCTCSLYLHGFAVQ